MNSDKVTWWAMGRGAAAKYGAEKALAMADDIKNTHCRELFLSGVNGEPRPAWKAGGRQAVKGYNKLELAQAAAERLRARGYDVTIEARNGWCVLHLTSGPTCDLCVDGDCTGRCDQNQDAPAPAVKPQSLARERYEQAWHQKQELKR